MPDGVKNRQPIANVASQQRLNITLGLPLRNASALSNFLDDLYNPSSPEYGHYLSPGQFTEQFGPTAEEYEAVIAFAQTNGLEITGLHSNRMLVNVSGSVGTIEKAFHIALHEYQHPNEKRTFFAPDSDPVVDAALPILHVGGLDNFVLPHPAGLISKTLEESSTPLPNAGSGPSGTYAGRDFRAAYAPGVTLTGAGQTLALVQFDGFYSGDISQYESQFGLPSVPIQTVLLDGFNGAPGTANDEVALDIEMAISMAPGLSRIVVYEAGPYGSGDDILNRIASDNTARQISASWSFGTTPITSQIFQQFAAQGQSYFNAAGDSDAYSGTIPSPCDNPYITVVGGTTLSTTGADGPWLSETTWNWGAGQGTGGGISTRWAIPSWQRGVDMTLNHGSTSRRNIPDVAMTADSVYVISSNGRHSAMGGTSCASPLWAAFTALINQQAAAGGKAAAGFLNPALYSIGNSSGYASCFHDITTGNNTSSGSPGVFYAVAGYDLCTGWGSPSGQKLIDSLSGATQSIAGSSSVTLLNPHYAAGAMTFSFATSAGQTYAVEYKDDLRASTWSSLQSITGNGALQTVTDRSGGTQRFYRVHVQ